MILPALVLAVLLIVAIQAVRHPVLRRLAGRNALRRPTETLLVVAGSLLGTALITGSLIVGDTLDSSIEQTAFTQLGPVDEVAEFPSAEGADDVAGRLGRLDDERIDGVLRLTAVQAAVAHSTGERRFAEPEAQILETDFAAARSFGDDPAATGIEGDTPGPGRVVLGEDLALRLEAEAGDRVRVFLYGSTLALDVERVLPRLGVAGFWRGQGSASQNAFVAPGTIEAAARSAQRDRETVPPAFAVLVSNRGDVRAGEALSDAVTEAIEEVAGAGVRVDKVKQQRIEEAEVAGEEFGGLFLAIGSFAIIAGILLLVNIFVMLAEERKSNLGMLRAIGMKRGHLVRAFVMEGTVYSFFASLLGAGAGIGVGWAIAKAAAPIFGGFDDFALDLRFAMDPASLVTGACSGFLIAVFTVTFTSMRVSRINIIRAIRDLPEPQDVVSRGRTAAIGALAALACAVWFATSVGKVEAWAGSILGLPLAAFALVPLASRHMPRRTVLIAAAALGLLWGIFGNRITNDSFFEGGQEFAFVLQGILLTFSAVVLLSQTQEVVGVVTRRLLPRNVPARLGVAYPLARRFRTALTLGMFALVIFTMTFIAVMSNLFGGQVETAIAKEGRFDVLATANAANPPTEAEIAGTEGVGEVSTLLSATVLYTTGERRPLPWPATGIDEDFVSGGPPRLDEIDPSIGSPEAAWQRLMNDPKTIIVPSWFLQQGGGPPEPLEVGTTVTMIDPLTGKELERRLIAIVENDFAFSGSYLSKASLQEAVGDRAAPSRFYVKTDEGADVGQVARRLQGTFLENGVEADPFRTLIEDLQSTNLQFFRLMQAYLALGLLVGIAGLGVVMIRAVRDRRRQIGVLRALGLLPPQVRRAFVFESAFVAAAGIVVGIALALVTADQLIATDSFGEGLKLQVPWVQLAVVGIGSFVAALAATAWPAHQASTIPPAVALRIAD